MSSNQEPSCTYHVKVFDGTSKRTPRCVREIHQFTGQFTSIDQLHQVLCAELGNDLPSSYNHGYFEGRCHTKRWLTNYQDLEAMKEKFTTGDICLWCDTQHSEDHVSRNRSPPRRKPSKEMRMKRRLIKHIRI